MRYPISTSDDPLEQRLSNWMHWQRIRYGRNQLSPLQVRRLEALPQWLWLTVVHKSKQAKQQLLEIARNGENKPLKGEHPLGIRLGSYTYPSSSCYDPVFDKEIRELRPDWFPDTAKEAKQQLLEMAHNGEGRPVAQKHPLGYKLCNYTNPNASSYDPEFDKEIRELRPDWFANTADLSKQQLLEMARNGEARPTAGKHPLGEKICAYTSPNSQVYDSVFAKEIRELRPDWFVLASTLAKALAKQQLLEMARNGEARPIIDKHPLGTKLSRYTNVSSGNQYDPKFDKEIRELRPDWFIGNPKYTRSSISLAKQQLLEMARNGEARPVRGKHPLGRRLGKYTNASNGTQYDPKFDKEIRALRPDWFDTAKQAKQQLLEMARNGEGRPTSGKHPLGQKLCNYTNPNTSHYSCYDPEFDKEIRALRPDWFRRRKKAA